MSDHPYKLLPAGNYWKRSVSTIPMDQVDPVIQAKFRIRSSDKVATAGSCFAQHISRHLHASGFNYFVAEQANPIVPKQIAAEYGYGMYSARYGNVYTSRQMIQLLHRAYGQFQPIEDTWQASDGYVIDPFRPQIQPKGFASEAEFFADRRQHFAAIRRAVEGLDVFVFTLGLTETWISKIDGAVFPLCPGVSGGIFDTSRHEFQNLSVSEVLLDLKLIVAFIRERNSSAKFILTVSPVPLVATAEPRSVIVSTAYSKAVLRVAAEEAAARDSGIAYFPSYEIVTGLHTRGQYFQDDHRSVTEEGVRRVMTLFLQHCTEKTVSDGDLTQVTQASDSMEATQLERQKVIAEQMAVMCDEEALDK